MALLVNTGIDGKGTGEATRVGYPIAVARQPEGGLTQPPGEDNKPTNDTWKTYLYVGIGALSIAILGWLIYKNR